MPCKNHYKKEIDSMKSRTENVTRNLKSSILFQCTNIIIKFLLRTVFIYALGKEYLGVNGVFTNILTVLSLSELGLGTAIIYDMYQPIAENNIEKEIQLFRFYRYIYAIVGSIILLLGLLLVPFLKYIIKDSSNNTISKKLNLIVKEQTSTTVSTTKPSTPTVRKRYNFNDAIANFKNDNTLIGIDVSRYQGDIDYEKVKNAGCEFVMMRIGVQSGFKKELSIDSYYLKNIENAKKAGLKVGVYLYSTAVNDKIAKEQAEWVIKTLNGTKLDFPIAFDWENWQYIREYETSLYDLSSAYLTFANYIEEHGYKAMLYGSKYYLENMWMDKGNYPVWLAHYTEKTNYSSDYIMWQFSQIGEIDGINSDVDLNVYYIK